MLCNLITQRETIKVIHWLFFSCRVNSFKKYRQPGIMRKMCKQPQDTEWYQAGLIW